MIETAIRISDQKISIPAIDEILSYGRELLNKPVHVLDGVEEVLAALQPKYKLVMASKGDLLDQHRKLSRSGLGHYFHHIEIMSEKREEDYLKLIRRLDIEPAEFLMIGNSMKSDVLPVLNIGGHGIHVPYHTTWAHEKVEDEVEHGQFRQAEKIIAVLTMV
jgi:putative hydrolase of the HAD superfamily